jgi:cobyrinic acid a,c-diamide synthase
MGLVIAGERSGVGKTTVTLALLAGLRSRQQTVQSFKVGPDYIDPMFHQFVTGRACRNLDPVLTSETYVQACFARHAQTADYAIVEGVMGLFDGATGREDWASTAHIARLLDLPLLLVLDCSRMSRSIAAVVHGYRSFDPRLKWAGVILNRVGSDRHLTLLKEALEPLDLPILGVVRRCDDIVIPDRHLGLVPAAELNGLAQLIDRLAHLGKTWFDWRALLPLMATSDTHLPQSTRAQPAPGSPLRIAVAYDRAFSFYYADNLDLLQQLGAELVNWSPLSEQFPNDIQGLYLGGGFPEMFAESLAENTAARTAVRSAISAGMPTYAECGGLMYLATDLVDFAGRAWPMVGLLPTTAVMEKRLTLGYRRAIALQDSPLVPAGAVTWGHEFHRSRITRAPEFPLYQLQPYDADNNADKPMVFDGWATPQLHASYVHLHWGASLKLPQRFLNQCREFVKSCPPARKENAPILR